jgi:hypothetical protein
MQKRTADVFGLGQCSLDCIRGIMSYPLPDAKCEFTGMILQGGGPVATALVAMSHRGLSCYFAGMTLQGRENLSCHIHRKTIGNARAGLEPSLRMAAAA